MPAYSWKGRISVLGCDCLFPLESQFRIHIRCDRFHYLSLSIPFNQSVSNFSKRIKSYVPFKRQICHWKHFHEQTKIIKFEYIELESLLDSKILWKCHQLTVTTAICLISFLLSWRKKHVKTIWAAVNYKIPFILFIRMYPNVTKRRKKIHKTTTQWDDDDQYHFWVTKAIICHFSTVCTSTTNISFVFLHMIGVCVAPNCCCRWLMTAASIFFWSNMMIAQAHIVSSVLRGTSFCQVCRSYVFHSISNLEHRIILLLLLYLNASFIFKCVGIGWPNQSLRPHTHIIHANKFVLNFKTNSSWQT